MKLLSKPSQGGFTLIELMVTVVVLGVVLSIGVPSFQSQIRNNTSIAMGEDFTSALAMARIEAITRGKRVSICRSLDGVKCAAPGDWKVGFMVYVDQKTVDMPAVLETGVGEVIKVWPAQKPGSVLQVKQGTQIAFIGFTGNGTLVRLPTVNTAVTVVSKVNSCTGLAATEIGVNLVGMVSSRKKDCGV